MNRIGITMGDPAGVGPEVVLQALGDPEIRRTVRPLVFGDGPLLSKLAGRFGYPGELELIQTGNLDLADLEVGRFTDQSGRSALACLEAGALALEAGKISALVTGPIHKQALTLDDRGYPGQTEWLANRFGATPAMLLHGERLKVVLATTHIPLRVVPQALADLDLEGFIRMAASELKRFFFPGGPRLAVAALNPHGEQDGRAGQEERELVMPAITRLKESGLDVSGPIAGDTVFALAAQGRFDVVVALYHDQGLAPLKALHFGGAVNATLGLGVIRTSPDHGVAYDIAHQGKADAASMKAAIRLASEMAAKV